jgi:RimJ/RimL family protein N-acetyltransferase
MLAMTMPLGIRGEANTPSLSPGGGRAYDHAMENGLEIRTPRLLLSPPAAADLDGFAGLVGDPATMRFIGGPLAREAAWQRLQVRAGSWLMLGFGMWMVREAGSKRIIGEVGFLDGKRAGVAGFHGDPEIGWALAVDAHGRGLGREAVSAALDWGGQRFAGRFARTVAMIDPGHGRSIALAEALGFRRFAETAYQGRPRRLWDFRWRDEGG